MIVDRYKAREQWANLREQGLVGAEVNQTTKIKGWSDSHGSDMWKQAGVKEA